MFKPMPFVRPGEYRPPPFSSFTEPGCSFGPYSASSETPDQLEPSHVPPDAQVSSADSALANSSLLAFGTARSSLAEYKGSSTPASSQYLLSPPGHHYMAGHHPCSPSLSTSPTFTAPDYFITPPSSHRGSIDSSVPSSWASAPPPPASLATTFDHSFIQAPSESPDDATTASSRASYLRTPTTGSLSSEVVPSSGSSAGRSALLHRYHEQQHHHQIPRYVSSVDRVSLSSSYSRTSPDSIQLRSNPKDHEGYHYFRFEPHRPPSSPFVSLQDLETRGHVDSTVNSTPTAPLVQLPALSRSPSSSSSTSTVATEIQDFFGLCEPLANLQKIGGSALGLAPTILHPPFEYSSALRSWICYRRNYLSLSVSLELPSSSPLHFHPSHPAIPVVGFKVSITAHTSARDGLTPLLQFDASRNLKQAYPVAPVTIMFREAALHTSTNFSRLQFRHATANNGKAQQEQERFSLRVNLDAVLTDGKCAPLGRWTSGDLVVRGRSPKNFVNARVDMCAKGAVAGEAPAMKRTATKRTKAFKSVGEADDDTDNASDWEEAAKVEKKVKLEPIDDGIAHTITRPSRARKVRSYVDEDDYGEED